MSRAEPASVGAVAYHPRIVPIWEVVLDLLHGAGLPVDYVLYSNYERQVDALLTGQIDIGWNTNTAYVRPPSSSSAATARILGMRDVDSEFATVMVTRAGETFG